MSLGQRPARDIISNGRSSTQSTFLLHQDRMSSIKDLIRVATFIVQSPLNARHKCRALAKFVRWQVASRALGMKVIVPWVDDSRFIVGRGEAGLTGSLYCGFGEYEGMLFLLHALQPDEVFVDVGANRGAYTILASKVVKSRSISFEPMPGTVESLLDQVHINRIEPIVDVREMGVGDKPGTLFFTAGKDTENRVSVSGNSEGTSRVKVTTLDSELDEVGRCVIKIDVEGFEYNVLEGASQVLSTPRVSAVIIELNGSGEEYGHSNEEIHRKLLGFGLFPISYDPLSRKVVRMESYNKHGESTIYVKDLDMIAGRCRSAVRRTVHTAFGFVI